MSSGDLRMLGARDGLISALLIVRGEIRELLSTPINPRHSRRMEKRRNILERLRRVEGELAKELQKVTAAYEESTGEKR